MFRNSLFRFINVMLTSNNSTLSLRKLPRRYFKVGTSLLTNEKFKEIVPISDFDKIENKNKKTYLEMVKIFEAKGAHRRGHVEFIYAALKNMKEFGVHKDLQVYKALVDVMPKGRFIPTNIFQAEFMHYPKQQQCIIDLLEQMEDNGVMPDYEMEDILLNIFGKRGFPLRKFYRMMYWMPKFKNLTPWPVPDPLPNDVLELAKLAIARISSVDNQSKITIFNTSEVADSLEETWIVSAQSPTQKVLLKEHSIDKPVYVEGAFKIWIKTKCVNYFILRGDPKPPKFENVDMDDVSKIEVPLFNISSLQENKLESITSVHEQNDGIIYAVCATGTSGRDSVLSWIRLLEKDDNPNLAHIPVVFTLKSPESKIAVVDSQMEKTDTL